MKYFAIIAAVLSLACLPSALFADENHEIIEKVMKEGLKGDDSPLAKVLDGKASAKEKKDLAELIQTMAGTKAPVGEQDAYDTLVEELIATMDAVAGGDDSPAALDKLDNASNCKACHTDHKPKKEKK